MSLTNRDAAIHGNEVRLGGFASHADALAALSAARQFEADALRLADAVLSLNPTAGELGEGKARNLQALAARLVK